MNQAMELRGAIRDFTDPMIVMRRVVDQALAVIPAAEGAVVELARDGHLTYVCTAGNLADYVGTRLRQDSSLSGLAVSTATTLHCEDSDTDERVDREACRRVGAASLVCVPLRRRGEPVGVLKVTAPHAHAFHADDVSTLTRLADFITTAIAAASDLAQITGELLSDNATPNGGSAGHAPLASVVDDHAVSEFVANVLRPGIVGDIEARQRIERVIARSALTIAVQPLVQLHTGRLIGAEALARFAGPPLRGPDAWFAEAHRVGLGVQLELAALRSALRLVDQLPDSAYLAVNVGPQTIVSSELQSILASAPADRLVLELTEHLEVSDYDRLCDALAGIRGRGARLAIDDTGAGFASLAHILKLAPDIIKLDRALTTGIDGDPIRRALAGALVTFAAETGATVVAEGIETAHELETVCGLGIAYGQGYFIGKPAPVDSLPRTVGDAG